MNWEVYRFIQKTPKKIVSVWDYDKAQLEK